MAPDRTSPPTVVVTDNRLITLHCPSTPQTRRTVDAQSPARMKDGVLLVNVARGTLVDQAALIEVLQSGTLGAASLDVADTGPIEADSPLRMLDQVVITSHIASAKARAVSTLRQSVAETVVLALRGGPVPHCANGVPR